MGGFAAIFRKKKSNDSVSSDDKSKSSFGSWRNSTKKSSTNTIGTASCSTGHSRASRNKGSSDDVPALIDHTPTSIRIVKHLMDVCNSHDSVAFRALFTDNARFCPEDVRPVPIEGLVEVFKNISDCFPDSKYSYSTINKDEEGTNLIVVEGARFSGTHTAAPYSPAPDKFPPVHPKGKFIENDEERWFFDVDKESGKVKSWAIIALGPATGPMGIYESVCAAN